VPRAPRLRRGDETLEQLYVSGGTGHYRPFVLAEGIVTLIESRSGTHHSTVRSYLAPMAPADGRVLWNQASIIDSETLELRAVPDPGRELEIEITPEALMQSAAQSQEGFRQFLEQNEKMSIFHNPAFAFYSEPSETREAFLQRCMEEATRQLSEQQERLESTFRRRIDQLREKSEREQRELEKSEEHMSSDAPEVNVAWGQALYNITSGRPAAVADANVSVRETDYLENIAQIQRAWDRERDTLREELNAKARSIEEISITPTGRNIEITRYLILWAPQMG
jgi:hypothetical protein